MASNPYVNKVIYDQTTLIDLTSDTAEASDVLYGKAFHLATGQASTGTAVLAVASVSGVTLNLTNGFPVSIPVSN